MLKSGSDLSELPGIGKDLAGKIADIVKTGHFGLLDTLKRKLPGELGDMAALPGLGPKRIKLLYDKLKVRTLNDLRKAIKTGRLRELRGFGPVIEKKLLGALEKPQPAKRFKLAVAEAEAEALVGYLRGSGRVVVAGSYRRRRDTVGDLDVLVTAKNGAAVGDRLVEYENVAQVVGPRTDAHHCDAALGSAGRCPRGAGGKLWRRAAVFYRFEGPQHRVARACQSTRLEAERIRLIFRQAADRRRDGRGRLREARTAFIDPELREDRGEIAAAQAGKLPRLVKVSDMRGDLHVHSDWTDGTVPIAGMAEAAQARGYEYIALTDHSRRVAMTHGLDPARLARQIHEIDRLNEKFRDFTILRGIEVDILKDGSLDLPDLSLAKLDIVVAAVHSYFDLPRKAQTERVVRALENRHVSILAHPTGRLIGEREPYDIDMDRVISAARKAGCYLEINAEPDRLDLNDLHAHAAKLAGVKLAVSTDAHSIDAFQCMRFGIDQARRAWLTANDVLNTRPLVELRKLLKR